MKQIIAKWSKYPLDMSYKLKKITACKENEKL